MSIARARAKFSEIERDLAEEERENQAPRPPVANPAFDFETRLGEDEDGVKESAEQDEDDGAWSSDEGDGA